MAQNFMPARDCRRQRQAYCCECRTAYINHEKPTLAVLLLFDWLRASWLSSTTEFACLFKMTNLMGKHATLTFFSVWFRCKSCITVDAWVSSSYGARHIQFRILLRRSQNSKQKYVDISKWNCVSSFLSDNKIGCANSYNRANVNSVNSARKREFRWTRLQSTLLGKRRKNSVDRQMLQAKKTKALLWSWPPVI